MANTYKAVFAVALEGKNKVGDVVEVTTAKGATHRVKLAAIVKNPDGEGFLGLYAKTDQDTGAEAKKVAREAAKANKAAVKEVSAALLANPAALQAAIAALSAQA